MRVEISASWFMVIRYGSVEIQQNRDCGYLLEIQPNAHISSKIEKWCFRNHMCYAETHKSAHTPCLFPVILVSMSVGLCVCAKQCYQAQTE